MPIETRPARSLREGDTFHSDDFTNPPVMKRYTVTGQPRELPIRGLVMVPVGENEFPFGIAETVGVDVPKAAPRPRIDTLTVGTKVRLDFGGDYEEEATFMGITGTGDDRRATFESVDEDRHDVYTWQAYRYNRRWAFGTSAQTLSLVKVVEVAE